ncbi:hypothetical protein HPB48_013678 [Haemaphysalis longicornis]|uniref:Uncharacterized protein n=1 Tax=Haemaphysalis longicornis TaxID=44386 RepID=A0A9J6GGJ1_HAELO|nr:hypothetical protein HPB48_013678 [Haemaphysalis longicornis]
MASATAPTTGIGAMSTEDEDLETASSDSDALSHTGKSKTRSPEEITARKNKQEERRRLRTASQKNPRLVKLCVVTLPPSTPATSRQTATESTQQWGPPLQHEQPAVDGEACLSMASQVLQTNDLGTAVGATTMLGGYTAAARDLDPEDVLDRTWDTLAKRVQEKARHYHTHNPHNYRKEKCHVQARSCRAQGKRHPPRAPSASRRDKDTTRGSLHGNKRCRPKQATAATIQYQDMLAVQHQSGENKR